MSPSRMASRASIHNPGAPATAARQKTVRLRHGPPDSPFADRISECLFKRVLPACPSPYSARGKHIQRPACQREKISVASSARFRSRADGSISAEHDKHFRVVHRRFRKRPLNLVRLSTPRLAIRHTRAFEDVQHFCLGVRVAAAT